MSSRHSLRSRFDQSDSAAPLSNATVYLNASTMEVEATPGHLALLTLDHELELARYVRSKKGGLMYGPLLYRSGDHHLF